MEIKTTQQILDENSERFGYLETEWVKVEDIFTFFDDRVNMPEIDIIIEFLNKLSQK